MRLTNTWISAQFEGIPAVLSAMAGLHHPRDGTAAFVWQLCIVCMLAVTSDAVTWKHLQVCQIPFV
jgi:hypothetical protein